MFPASYRSSIQCKDLVSFDLSVKETDLRICAVKNLKSQTLKLVLKYRGQLEKYIDRHPEFRTSLSPLPFDDTAPLIVKSMLRAGTNSDTGPMASVAGAIAEFVGKELLNHSPELIIENGGDIFLKSNRPRVVGIYAGESPFGGRIGLEISPGDTPIGICTSSGTIGHSLSFGKADAVIMISPSATRADAGATAVGNIINTVDDIQRGLEKARSIEGITGALIIKDDKMGSWGNIKLCRT